MKLVPSKEMKINLLPDQEDYLCTKETIREIFAKDEKNICLAFDIYMEDQLVGFAMFCEQMKGIFFLWNFAIDAQYQHKGIGTKALQEVLAYMLSHYHVKVFSTTYSWGNEHAKKLYEIVGFYEVNVVEEDDYKEVNMIYAVDAEAAEALKKSWLTDD
ncbi:MAG: GNAT family N-acetyltransferase [Clostridia bacterium]|nr:GNAT family N-acetyltransferase [Clostridia bacterium]